MERPEPRNACPRLAVGIATTGRRGILRAALPHLLRQARPADMIVICAAEEADVDRAALGEIATRTRIIFAERGLCRQRNAILAHVDEADILLFLDDDFLMASTYLAEVEQLFAANADLVMATGRVEADGISGPGIALSDGLRLLDGSGYAAGPSHENPVYSAYGCNMAVRMETVRSHSLAFDENLPLYGWLEDVDFSRQMARHGRIVRSDRLRGVHLGTKSGRTSGVRLGYSQIANPIYLMRKKTMSFRHAAPQMARNLAANTLRLAAPEPWIDRRGRLRGNLRALADLVRGRLAPQNVSALE
ncbi:glycosyltransferase family 2 protein [Nitratireductor pacificus]|uniref:glycosyltransferase family 2 protein n=1 Tax=Nitratireductor pacificus TaxID=1231180 RepID=UPI0005931F88|nr:glycosyltransferase [Nitratireductor pacificus]